MWWSARNFAEHAAANADLESPPDAGPVKRWLVGVGVAAALATLGIYWIAVRRAAIPGRLGWIGIEGLAAVAAGVVVIGLAGLLHFHYLWAPSERFWPAARPGKIVSLTAVAGGILATIFLQLFG